MNNEQQFHANKPEGRKYALHKNFTRLVRGMESYPIYIERGDIVELEYKSLKTLTGSDFEPVKMLFKSSNYHPIMLINATAQVALTHHLDDEVSKIISVPTNEKTAKRKICVWSTRQTITPLPRSSLSSSINH